MRKKEQKGTILVGISNELLALYKNLKHPERVFGVFCDDEQSLPEGLSRLGAIDDVPAFLDEHLEVQRVYCSMSQIQLSQIKMIQHACKARAVRFCMVMPIVNDLDCRLTTMRVACKTLLTPVSEPLQHLHNRMLKRLLDLAVSIVFLLVFFPIIYLCKLPFIKRRQRGPSFVTDRCCGPNGRVFSRISLRFDERSWARMFNVFVGSMSLVGPECYVLHEEEEPINLPKRLERRFVKAGMTGWARVKKLQESQRLEADIYYAEHWSLWLDVKILFMTLFSK